MRAHLPQHRAAHARETEHQDWALQIVADAIEFIHILLSDASGDHRKIDVAQSQIGRKAAKVIRLRLVRRFIVGPVVYDAFETLCSDLTEIFGRDLSRDKKPL